MDDTTTPEIAGRWAKFWSWVHGIDWRILSIVLTVLITLLITAILYILYLKNLIDIDPAKHVGAVFAGWVAGVALFAVGGAAVGIVSLSRPEEEPFEARARILFRKQKGPHIEYIVGWLRDWLEPYSEITTRTVRVVDYDAASKMFQLEVETNTRVRSYIDDVDVPFSSKVKYTKFSASPPGKRSPSLTFLRLNGQPSGSGVEFAEELERPFVTAIPEGGACTIEHTLSFWIKEKSEPNTHSPVRYTQKFVLKIENRLLTQSIGVDISVKGGSWTKSILGHSETRELANAVNLKPKERVYDFRIMLEGADVEESGQGG